jgi:hypothetical protein
VGSVSPDPPKQNVTVITARSMISRALIACSVAALLAGCGGSSPFVTPPVGTMGYTVLGTTYLGASTSNVSHRSGGTMLRIIPTFNTARYVTVWIPANAQVGSYQTGVDANGTCFVDLDDSDLGDPFPGIYRSIASSGTVSVTAISSTANSQRGHITGTFSSLLQDGSGNDILVQSGSFDCDFHG